MGLKLDIKSAFLESMSYEDMPTTTDDDVDARNAMNDVADKLADNLRDSIIDFLTKQTFTITEMKASLEIEEFKTTIPFTGDVLPGVVVTATGGPVVSGKSGVLIPKLNIKKYGGTGGGLVSNGHAYIGPNPVRGGETNERKTKVKLLKKNIVHK